MLFPLGVLFLWLVCLSSGTGIQGDANVPKDKLARLKVESGKPPQSINVKFNYKNLDLVSNDSLPHHIKLKIMGGHEPDHRIREAPSVVSIMVFDGKEFSHKCGGSICSDDRVITSAYCVYDIPVWYILIQSGTDCLDSDDTESAIHRVKDVKIHEDYDYTKSAYDIAILQTKGKFDFRCSSSRTQFPLPIGLSYMPVGTNCKVFGWGYLKEPDEYPETSSIYFPKCIRKIDLQIVEHEICRKAYVGVFESVDLEESPVTDHQVCAAGNLLLGGQDVCYGDEGAPLICYSNKGPVLVGIASYGFGCGRPHYPGVYTSVFQLMPWIAKYGCPLCHNDVHLEKSSLHSHTTSAAPDTPVKNEL